MYTAPDRFGRAMCVRYWLSAQPTFKKRPYFKHKLTQKNKSTTVSSSRARWYHKIDTPQKTKTVVRNAVELVPPTAYMIIH